MARAKLYEGNFGDNKFKGQADLIVKSLLTKSPQTAQEIANDIKADLTTRQDPIRVVSFYMSTWKKSGLVKVVGTANETPVSTGTSSSAASVADNEREDLQSSSDEPFQSAESIEEIPDLPTFDYEGASLKEAVLHVLGRFEDHSATPQDLTDELNQCGKSVTKNQVRDALSKLNTAGKVSRADAGAFQLSASFLEEANPL